jgi:lysophospholipase
LPTRSAPTIPQVPGRSPSCQGLPKSNHGQEAGISPNAKDGSGGNGPGFDRRAIPPGAIESTWSAPDGLAIRQVRWTPPEDAARGSILFLPGRGDAYEKYLETFEHWRLQGWQVTSIDWRGQAGSGRLGADAVTGHVEDFGVWIADLAAYWPVWSAANPRPQVLAGHSMGGHLALRAVAEKCVDPDALVLSAPMLGFISLLPRCLMHWVARMMRGRGDPRRPAWKWSEKPGEVPAGRQRLLTHDNARYADELWWRERRPELKMGPGSWGWVERGFESNSRLDRPGVLEAIRIPVFAVTTSNDKLVSPAAIERAMARIPGAEVLRFGKEAHHEILREADPVRDRALAGIDDFLDRVAPRDKQA